MRGPRAAFAQAVLPALARQDRKLRAAAVDALHPLHHEVDSTVPLSGRQPCGQGPDTYALISRAVSWLEENSGIGTWNPTAASGGFATDPTNSAVSWNNGCGTPTSGLESTCGPAFGSPPDNNPPSVAIVDPLDGASVVANQPLGILVDAHRVRLGVTAGTDVITAEKSIGLADTRINCG